MFGSATPNRPGFAERLGRGAEPPTPPAEQAADTGEYRAFGCFPTNGLGETCDVQRWIDGTEIAEGIEFQYRFLMQVGYVGEEEIRLMLPDTIILLEGRHLRELRKKLARRQVHHIAQYSPR